MLGELEGVLLGGLGGAQAGVQGVEMPPWRPLHMSVNGHRQKDKTRQDVNRGLVVNNNQPTI